jgi:hypothetical protein
LENILRAEVIQFVFVLLWAFAQDCMANDSIGAVGAAGIEFKKSSDISMEKETLTIYEDRIRVEYDFLNKSTKPIRERILFPMPFYSFDLGCSPEYSGDLQLFRVWINGEELKPKRTVRARLSNGADVTQKLKDIGFDDDDIAEYHGVTSSCGQIVPTPDDEFDGIYAEKIDLLTKEGLADNHASGDKPLPLWQASYVYYWDQEFPPNKKISVDHEYVPFVGTGPGYWGFLGEQYSKKMNDGGYCIDQGTYRAAKKASKAGYVPTFVDYILTTGANWAGPIKDFTLILKKSTSDDVISLCFDGHFKRQDETTLISNIKNFTPKKDISVLFMSPQTSHYETHPHY